MRANPSPTSGAEPHFELTPLEAFSLAIYNLLFGIMSVGLVGAVILYVCCVPATLTGAFYSDRMFFRGAEARFLVWCGRLFDKHLVGFVAYTAALFFLPLPLIWLFELVGLQKVVDGAGARCKCLSIQWRYPGRPVVWTILGVLFLPFVPTIIAAIVGYCILLGVIIAAFIYVFSKLGRSTAGRYFVTRIAVRHGAKDAFRKSF